MKVLLANLPWISNDEFYAVRAGSRWPHVREKKESMVYFPFPFYLAYAAAVLKEAGHNIIIKDCITENINEQDFLEILKNEKPDAVIYETSTPSIYNDLAMAKATKETIDTITILTGPHVSALPEESLKEDYVDYVIRGEYEVIIRELLKKIEKKDTRGIMKMQGVCSKHNKKMTINGTSELIENLDNLPLPLREALPMEKYLDAFCTHSPNMQMITSRGCPYRCIYCLEAWVYYGKPNYRYRSAQKVVDEMEYLINKYHPKEIYFDDASFTINEARVIELCEEIKKRIKLPWSCMVDARIEEGTIRAMAEAGCIAVKFGVESANAQILSNIGKNLNLEQVKNFVDICRKYKIRTHATYMIGLPGETKETIKETIDFAFKKLKTETAQFAITIPYPGTPMHKLAEQKGWLVAKDYTEYDGGLGGVLEYPELKKKDFLDAAREARKRMMIKVATNPRLALQVFAAIYKYEGLKGVIRNIFDKLKYVFRKGDKDKGKEKEEVKTQ